MSINAFTMSREIALLPAKRFYPKRSHRKSRYGCKQCRDRKVKCTEDKPSCRTCILRGEKCHYPRLESTPEELSTDIIQGPNFRPDGMQEDNDMKMLWYYTLEGYNAYTIGGDYEPPVGDLFRIRMVEHAFKSPFLMQFILGLAALQLRHSNVDISIAKVIAYQTRACSAYRSAIQKMDPSDFPALIAASLLMPAVGSESMREPNSQTLGIVDWIATGRGIMTVIEMVSPQSIYDSGLAALFYRPLVDLDKAALAIPSELLLLCAQIQPTDLDFDRRALYVYVLKHLGQLYLELRRGFSPMLELRIATFGMFMPPEFISLANQHHPIPLIILAYFCAFLKLATSIWWMQGIAESQLPELRRILGPEWEVFLAVPSRVVQLSDRVEIARTLLGNACPGVGTTDDWNIGDEALTWTASGSFFESCDGGEKWVLTADGVLMEQLSKLNCAMPLELAGEHTLLGRRRS